MQSQLRLKESCFFFTLFIVVMGMRTKFEVNKKIRKYLKMLIKYFVSIRVKQALFDGK